MTKRANGEGNVRKRTDGRYEARLMVDGKRHSVFGETRSEVVAQLDDMRDRIKHGQAPKDARITVEEWLDRWQRTGLLGGNRKRSTIDVYRRHIRNHLVPHLGHHRLDRLRKSHITGMLGSMDHDGKSASLRRAVFNVLSLALADAVDDDLLAKSPCDKVSRPEPDKTDPHWFRIEQVRRLLASVEGDRRAPLLALIARTGLRRGEALALKWEHVDLNGEHPHLLVRGTLSRLDGEGLVITTPKSDRSRRRLALDPGTVGLLTEHRSAQRLESMRNRDVWEDHDLVFCTEIGTPDDPRNVSRWAKSAIEAVGLTGSLHTLRHTAASLLVRDGVPMRLVADVLGHSSMRLTDEVYSHLEPDALRTPMEQLGSALDGVG